MKKITVAFIDYGLRLLIVWVLVSILSGCASKKKNSSTVDELHAVTTLQEAQGGAKIENNTNVLATAKKTETSTATSSKTTYKPVDPTKPSSVVTPEGKTYQLDNAEVTEEHNTMEFSGITENSTNSSISSTAEFWNKETGVFKVEDIKSTSVSSMERDGFNLWSWLWMLGIIAVVIVLVYLNNRFKWVSYVTSIFKRK